MATETGHKDRIDEPVGDDRDGLTVIDAINEYRREADDARRERMWKNRRNRDVFFGRQDFSHKIEGQSQEFLPKVPVSIEQMAAFVKRGLANSQDWFSVTLDETISDRIDGTHVRAILACYLDNLWSHNQQTTTLPLVLSDAVKNGLLESLMIFKVHGGMMPKRRFAFEPSRLQDVGDLGDLATPAEEPTFSPPSLEREEGEDWHLRIDLVRPEDYYPDPSGNGLYEIHRVERDLHEVVAASEGEDAIYDPAAVKQLIDQDFERPKDEERTDRDRNQEEATKPGFRKKVVLDEFWGTLLNRDGTVAHRNVVAVVANEKYLIRKPEPNPFWHQESPFVVAPLIRVPWSVWHKALYDHASQLNLAINELFNLIIDGGLSAVWGVKQVRLEDLEDPGQVAGGIKQGDTLAVKQTLPHGANVVDVVATGNVPQDAMAVFEFLNREYTQAALTNELRLGSFPSKPVRATEVVEASQAQAVTLDGIITDLEAMIAQLVRKAWLTLLQNADSIPQEAIVGITDRMVALLIMRASPQERFAMFAGKTQFKVDGLSAINARALDFQKLMALMQAVAANPMLFQAFLVRFSPERMLRRIMKTLNLNPADIEKSQEERTQEAMMQELQRTLGAQEMIGTRPGQQGGREATGIAGRDTGEPGLPAEINQLTNPTTGLVPNA